MFLLLPTVALAQTVPNPSLDGPAPTAVPNALAATDWTFDGASLAAAGVPIDCDATLLAASPDGGTAARAVATFDPLSGDVAQSLSTTVTGLSPGVPYRVRFTAALVRHYGQSTGLWAVTLDGTELDGPLLAPPAANPGATPWIVQTVESFYATAPEATLSFRAATLSDGVTQSPGLPAAGCPYFSDPIAADLLLDGIEVIGDSDVDGLWDDEEVALGTDPTQADTDGDGLLDGTEVELGLDPLSADGDGDGLLDPDELALGTDPNQPDTDGDGYSDGDEVAAGSDPLDTDDVPAPPADTADTGTTPTTSTDPTAPRDTAGPGDPRPQGEHKDDVYVGCECDAGGAGGVPWLALLLPIAWRRRR
ncbi:MAG: hypothetical protein R3F59_31750 [Myxococcota bacterium]